MSELPLVSIIIPVYNVEDYLPVCMQSVFKQDYTNLEIILVDDGSTDRSGMMCDKYAELDNRVQVDHKQNGGLSDARNVGLSKLHGEYVFFLDSDDVLHEHAISCMVAIQEKTSADIVMSSLCMFVDVLPEFIMSEDYKLYETKRIIEKMLYNESIGNEACGKLFRAKLWEENQFPVGILYEDLAVIYDMVSKANQVALCENAFYYYRVRETSIIQKPVTQDNMVLMDISKRVSDRLLERYPDLSVAIYRLHIVLYMKLLKKILDKGFDCFQDEQRRIVEQVRKYGRKLLFEKRVRSIDKIKIVTLLIHKRLFYAVYKIGDWRNRL